MWENTLYVEPMPITYARRCSKCTGRHVESMDKTEVPPMYRHVDITKFKFDIYQVDGAALHKLAYNFMNYFEAWEENSKGLYLWSKTPGSGKTFLACCLGKSIMIMTQKIFRFITVPDYMAKVGDSYKREKGARDDSAIYRECDLLVLDDIGAQMHGEWQEQELYRLIDTRLNHGKVTVFTSNSSVETLKLEERTKNRVQKSTISLHMPEESIRTKKATEEQTEFLKRMGVIQ